jgi:hypothetical protein
MKTLTHRTEAGTSCAVDAVGNESDPPWLEAMMDQAKAESLANAVMAAQRVLMEETDIWERANSEVSSLPASEDDDAFNAHVRELVRDQQNNSGDVKAYIAGWAGGKAKRLRAEAARDRANDAVKKAAAAAKSASDELVKFYVENPPTR